MLLDDRNKMVELYVDNLLWGNIEFKPDRVEGGWKKGSKLYDMVMMTCTWTDLYRKNKESEKIKSLTDKIAIEFIVARNFGALVGKMEDRNYEKHLNELHKDNEELSEQLKTAYIPPTDSKVGTT